MPSWEVHRLIYDKLQREVSGFFVWTPGLLDKVDEIIDKAYGGHDLGRGPDIEDFRRLLEALWLEFGDICCEEDAYKVLAIAIDGGLKCLGLSYIQKLEFKRKALLNPEISKRCLIYIPDDVLVLATLHHILDVALDCLLKTYPPITIDRSEQMFECAKAGLQHYKDYLRDLETMRGHTFDQVFDWLIEVLKERSKQIYTILDDYLRSRGLSPGSRGEDLGFYLKCYIERKEYYGILNVNGRPLPLAAAVNHISKLLKEGKKVVIGFVLKARAYPYPPFDEVIETSNVSDLIKKLSEVCKE